MWTHVREATYAVVDVETTGFDRMSDRVVEVACVLIRGGREVDAFSTLVDPGRPIPERATAVHGITDAHVRSKPYLEVLSPELQRICEGAIVVAHNAAFDRYISADARGSPRDLHDAARAPRIPETSRPCAPSAAARARSRCGR
ncbi:hypothetical protein WPS_21010 [Vulcanimicrobium alpinum]|uniref:Exonuclease domain-containing protein n=1 Tax=Vulcanimicrobium alpinum TaxID=3016050 RepID=A0AAN2C9R9_UNVUL|nr:3'-5' exonuclease [Vulcanimicrobium alpinum]BDE06825.1 hypothetical protein WPS_21010 [Vulcanimicrobium alpinum]